MSAATDIPFDFPHFLGELIASIVFFGVLMKLNSVSNKLMVPVVAGFGLVAALLVHDGAKVNPAASIISALNEESNMTTMVTEIMAQLLAVCIAFYINSNFNRDGEE